LAAGPSRDELAVPPPIAPMDDADRNGTRLPPAQEAEPVASAPAAQPGANPNPAPPAEPPPGDPPRFPHAANTVASTPPPRRDEPTLPMSTPEFNLKYEVDDPGPSGHPTAVELWVFDPARNTWSLFGEDDDKASPFRVNLGVEGKFGLSLVARSATGQGDRRPVLGDRPQTWVLVDSTPPIVQLDPPQVGAGRYAGKLAILWQAHDVNLAPRPVTLSWRPADQPDTPWKPIALGIENSGKFIWTVPENMPPRFHVKVEVADAVGNLGVADTTEAGTPVVVDRSRPHSRITGLEPASPTPTVNGPSARPIR
jgi:hypothetical protein